MDETGRLIGCCGLDCGECDMRQAVGNPKLQREYARWFKENLNQDVRAEKIGCTWCRGDRNPDKHWSADCWILKCCVDDHGLEYCSQCRDFACAGLEEWSGQDARYAAALNRLRQMRRAARAR